MKRFLGAEKYIEFLTDSIFCELIVKSLATIKLKLFKKAESTKLGPDFTDQNWTKSRSKLDLIGKIE